MEAGGNKYFQYKHHDISWDWYSVSLWVVQRTCNHEYVIVVIPLVEFNICSLELEYVNWSHNKLGLWLKYWKAILISDNTTLLDYKH